jgi:hypothetical protein
MATPKGNNKPVLVSSLTATAAVTGAATTPDAKSGLLAGDNS